jgi:hypothetical protein
MMRLFGCALGILLLATAQQMMGQAQVTVPPAEKHKTTEAQADAAIDADQLAEAGSSLDPWLQHQADNLLDVVGCYLGKKSLENEVALEKKTNSDPKRLIEVRIRLLKTLASHNTASHCR